MPAGRNDASSSDISPTIDGSATVPPILNPTENPPFASAKRSVTPTSPPRCPSEKSRSSPMGPFWSTP